MVILILDETISSRIPACRKTLFGTLTDCEKVRKTSNSHPSAYIGTVGRELRSKSKSLRSKPVFDYKVRNSPFLQIKTQRTKPHKLLTDFDDYGLF